MAPETVKVPEREMESFRLRVVEPPKDTEPPPVRLVPAETVMEDESSSELEIF